MPLKGLEKYKGTRAFKRSSFLQTEQNQVPVTINVWFHDNWTSVTLKELFWKHLIALYQERMIVFTQSPVMFISSRTRLKTLKLYHLIDFWSQRFKRFSFVHFICLISRNTVYFSLCCLQSFPVWRRQKWSYNCSYKVLTSLVNCVGCLIAWNGLFEVCLEVLI